MRVEVVTYNLESVRIASLCGATRVELCANPMSGGTSPSLALLDTIKEQLRIPVYVMVRPREGDFTYSTDEINILIKEIKLFKKFGASGIVCAALKADGSIDTEGLQRIVEASEELPVTFHRAFDHVPDAFEALDKIVGCGCARILTSGKKKSAPEGASLIKELIERAGEEIIILPGSGINRLNVAELIRITNCKEVHLSAKKILQRSSLLNEEIQLGSSLDKNDYQVTDENELNAVLEIVKFY